MAHRSCMLTVLPISQGKYLIDLLFSCYSDHSPVGHVRGILTGCFYELNEKHLQSRTQQYDNELLSEYYRITVHKRTVNTFLAIIPKNISILNCIKAVCYTFAKLIEKERCEYAAK